MQFRGVLRLLCAVFTITHIQSAKGAAINTDLEATALSRGYAIHLLKPLPRRNSGCETLFRDGEVLNSCDPNNGFDPEIEGVLRTYCEWNLNSHYQQDNASKWLEPYFNPDLISITDAKVGFELNQDYDKFMDRFSHQKSIKLRWIEIDLNDQITGSKLGALKCFPTRFKDFQPSKRLLLGSTKVDETAIDRSKIKSGLSIGDILEELNGYVEFVSTN